MRIKKDRNNILTHIIWNLYYCRRFGTYCSNSRWYLATIEGYQPDWLHNISCGIIIVFSIFRLADNAYKGNMPYTISWYSAKISNTSLWDQIYIFEYYDGGNGICHLGFCDRPSSDQCTFLHQSLVCWYHNDLWNRWSSKGNII